MNTLGSGSWVPEKKWRLRIEMLRSGA